MDPKGGYRQQSTNNKWEGLHRVWVLGVGFGYGGGGDGAGVGVGVGVGVPVLVCPVSLTQ